MPQPDYQEFQSLARSHTLIPVIHSVRADLLTPVSAFLAVAAREPYAFLLESAEGGEKVGRYTFLGVRPYMRLQATGDRIEISRDGRIQRRRGSPFETLRELLHEHSPAHLPGSPPFTTGAVGFFSYDAVRQLESLPQKARKDLDCPDCIFLFFDRLLAFDHLKHQVHIIAAADVRRQKPRAAYDRALGDIRALEAKLARSPFAKFREPKRQAGNEARPSISREKYLAAVRRAKNYIAAGDIFQVVLSQRLELPLNRPGFEIYRSLRALNPSPYMYFLRMGKFEIAGSSPEMLVKIQGRRIQYRPIAGTRPRGADDNEDQRLERELKSDEKERAEHVMLVDLGRNDVGRVSDYGSVAVKDLMFVERYSHVMHLVSAIEGRLRPDLDSVQAFAACFPAGTLTGAPKIRAMQIIEELEPVRRAIYGGAVLYADFVGNLDSCIAIRTMLLKDKKAYIQAGAGIVADSDPQREYEECQNKMKALIAALRA